MQLARRASLVVVLLLLASVGTASAECAWVLWSEIIAPSQHAELFEAHPTIDDCVQGLGSIVATMRAKGYEIPGDVSGLRSVAWQDGEQRGYLRCLPDTVDPRGPKETKR